MNGNFKYENLQVGEGERKKSRVGALALYLNSKNGSPQHLNIVRKNFLSC